MSGIELCFNCDEELSKCNCGDTYTYNNLEGPVCPYCGYQNIASDSDGLLFDESTTEYDCGSCSKIFEIDVSISYAWTARRIDKS